MKHSRSDKAWGYSFNPAVDPRDDPCPMLKDWRYEFACSLEDQLDKALEALKIANGVLALTGRCNCKYAYYPEDEIECTMCKTIRETKALIAELEDVEWT